MMLKRRNNVLLRTYAFATTPPKTTTSNSKAFVPQVPSRLFSSSTDIISPNGASSSIVQPTEINSSGSSPSPSPSALIDKYRPIAAQQTRKSFGGLAYCEIPDNLQRVIFVLGGPGSGKGTQSDLILQSYPCVHLSAGQLLRDETKREGSPHAQLIEECLVAGKIVPVEISLALLEREMREAEGRSLVFLVDGFPRNRDNLDGWTARMPQVSSVSGVLHYDCPLEVLEKRILERGKDSGRSDDNLESLRKRFQTFTSDTKPVLDMLRMVAQESCMKVFDIAANRPIDSVWQDTKHALNDVLTHDVLTHNMKLLEAAAELDANKYASLCAEEMLAATSPEDLLKAQEFNEALSQLHISRAELNFVSGTKVVLSYTRKSKGLIYKETRVWSHNMHGWKMIHFFRSPAETC